MLIQKGFVVWLTGLPMSGKSSIAEQIEGELLERGLKVEILDESKDDIHNYFCADSGVSVEDFNKCTEKLAFIAKLLTRNEVISICSAVSPTRENRDKVRNLIGDFLEVHVSCPVEVCKQRDKADKYKQFFENYDDRVYEEPLKAEVIINSDQESVEDSVMKVIKTLELLEWIPRVLGLDYSPEEEAKIHERLESLGYL